MIIEKMPLQLSPMNMGQVRINGKIDPVHLSEPFVFNPYQLEFLELFLSGLTIEQVVQSYLKKNVIVSFVAMRELLEFLAAEHLILNAKVRAYFQHQPVDSKGFIDLLAEKIFGRSHGREEIEAQVKNLPFFRTLRPELVDVFLNHAKIIEAPAQVTVCEAGKLQRSLFVLLEGQAVVLKRNSKGATQRMVTLSAGSVFGEVGFFLGTERTATVMTETKSLLLQIVHKSDVFDDLIKTEQARDLQKRFWVIHALLGSKVFKDIPEDCFDALIFAGSVKSITAKHWIFKEGDPGHACYVIVQGEANVVQRGRLIRQLGQGDCFGEVALIVSGGRRTASVQAQSELLVLEIDQPRFYQLLAENFMLACEFETVALKRIQADQTRWPTQ
jgi:CRP-like cAMP-binding protein